MTAMEMWEYWKLGIPCHQYRKEKRSDIDMMLFINEAINQRDRSMANQQNLLRELMKK